MKWILQLQSEKIINQHKHLIIKEYKLHNGERYFNRGNKKMHWVVWEFITVKKK
jgi:cytoskeletal protein RodZ